MPGQSVNEQASVKSLNHKVWARHMCVFVCRKGPVIEEVKADGNRISLESFLTQVNCLHALFFLKQHL